MPSAVTARSLVLAAALSVILAPGAYAQAPTLAPHRAVYELKLDDRRPSGGLDQARGRILFETTGNRCEGFTTNFRQVVELTMNGNRVVMDARTAHFEEGDGSGFRFTSRATQNGAPYMETDGSANRAADAVAVRLRKPREATSSLDRTVIFPTEHLLRIVEAAREGRTILEAKVFDGAESGDRVYDATAIIGRRMEGEPQDAEPAARDARLASLARWPVTISYFEEGKDGGTPAYSIAFELYENGVSRRMVINYPEFSLRGELIQLDWEATTPCERR
jgi:hypothetical protein